jgi:integrase
MRELQLHGTPAASALQWTILTAARASETLGAVRSEIKSPSEFARLTRLPNHFIDGETWVVPAERMKEGREHHVPLPPGPLALIAGRKGKLFPGHERQMLDLLNQLGPGYTVHGFRSSFADWAAEHDYPQELREMTLAHSVGDSVEQAYRRSTPAQQTARDDECVVKICACRLYVALTTRARQGRRRHKASLYFRSSLLELCLQAFDCVADFGP